VIHTHVSYNKIVLIRFNKNIFLFVLPSSSLPCYQSEPSSEIIANISKWERCEHLSSAIKTHFWSL